MTVFNAHGCTRAKALPRNRQGQQRAHATPAPDNRDTGNLAAISATLSCFFPTSLFHNLSLSAFSPYPQVKLSVLPPNWPAHVRTCDRRDKNDSNKPDRRGVLGDDQRDPHPLGSVSPAKPARVNVRRKSAPGGSNIGIDRDLSDSSVSSEDTDKEVLAMLRQAAGAPEGREEESGLLLVRYVCGVHRAHRVCSYCGRLESSECLAGLDTQGLPSPSCLSPLCER